MEENQFMHKLALFIKRFAGTNLVWFVMNAPIVVLGYLLTTKTGLSDINIYLVLCFVLAPFILFPATTAMFAVLRKFIMGEEVPIIQSFFKYYRENYVRSVMGGVIFTIAWALLGYLYLLLADAAYLFVIICAVIAIVLFMFILNYISVTVHMITGFTQALKNAFIFTISGNILTIAIGLISAGILYVNFNIAPVLIPFFSGSLIAYMAFWMFYKLVIGIQTIQDKQAREAQEAAETIEVEEDETEETLVIETAEESEQTPVEEKEKEEE